MPFETHEKNGVVWLTASNLNGVRHGFSTRPGGVSPAPWDSLNLRPGMGDGREAMLENYRRFCALLGADLERTVLSRQVHETNVRACTAADAGKGLFRERDYDSADALVTDVPGLTLFVFSADCGTVLLHDPDTGAVGAAHPGGGAAPGGLWRRRSGRWSAVMGPGRSGCKRPWGPASGSAALKATGTFPPPCGKPWGRTRRLIWKNGAPSGMWTWRG